jgi:hypothetical protein
MSMHAHRAKLAPFAPAVQALKSGRLVTGLLYLILLPLSIFAEPPEEKQLRSDLYILF